MSSANTALFFFKQHFSGGVSSELIIEPPSNQLMLPNNVELCGFMSSELTPLKSAVIPLDTLA